ncbi:MAG: hypothetical protein DLM61_03715 [Pseudonocardiales bacterium]|nr:MAG: hypothetical protein DLM61_03715 [Pseudonocardiales bacterium]
MAYTAIGALISDTLEPGALLSEADLAAQLGVSKTPVREALRRLASEGLVSPIAHVGYVIPQLTYRDIREGFEVREAIEGRAAALACEQMIDERLAALVHVFAQGVAELNGDTDHDLTVMRRLNDLLHETVLECADNFRFNQILAGVRNQVHRAIRAYVQNDYGRYEASLLEHRAIVDALERRDVAGAEAAMRSHVQSIASHVLKRYR